MKKSRFTEDRIIGVLKEHQAGIPTDVAAKADHFKQTLPGERPLSEYSWQHASGWDWGRRQNGSLPPGDPQNRTVRCRPLHAGNRSLNVRQFWAATVGGGTATMIESRYHSAGCAVLKRNVPALS